MVYRRRIRLSWQEKYDILIKCEHRGERLRAHEIGEVRRWAKSKLRLNNMPSGKGVKRIVMDKHCITRIYASVDCDRRKESTVTSFDIETDLCTWIESMWKNNFCLTDLMIQGKARRLQQERNISLQPLLSTNLQFSNVWLYMFKKRNGYKCYKSHGEGVMQMQLQQRVLP